MNISPHAIVSPGAKIGQDVKIGPFCVIDEDVVIGDGCVLESHVMIKNGSILGNANHLYEGAVIGGLPQCVGLGDEVGQVIIGNGNIIREHVTIHRAIKEQDATEIGDDCMLMVNVHIAHDCRVLNNVIIVNNAMLAGHVTVGNRAFISGAVGVHQFCRIGAFAMVGGQAHIVRDVPPYVTVDGLTSQVVGLNKIGLRRAGFSVEEIKTINKAYHLLYGSGLPWREIIKKMEEEHKSGPGLEMARFIATSPRGILQERHGSPHRLTHVPQASNEPATIKLHVVGEEESSEYPVKERRSRETG